MMENNKPDSLYAQAESGFIKNMALLKATDANHMMRKSLYSPGTRVLVNKPGSDVIRPVIATIKKADAGMYLIHEKNTQTGEETFVICPEENITIVH